MIGIHGMAYTQILVNSNVFIFDIAVRYTMTIKIMHSINNLGENVTCLLFG